MTFWESFKASYRATRNADSHSLTDETRTQSDWTPDDVPPTEDLDSERRDSRDWNDALRQRDEQLVESKQLIADLERATRDYEDTLRQREEQLAESKVLIRDLDAEVRKLESELKTRHRGTGTRGSDEKFRKLRRLVMDKVHPDRASGDKKLEAVLTAICKEINAEIDRINTA